MPSVLLDIRQEVISGVVAGLGELVALVAVYEATGIISRMCLDRDLGRGDSVAFRERGFIVGRGGLVGRKRVNYVLWALRVLTLVLLVAIEFGMNSEVVPVTKKVDREFLSELTGVESNPGGTSASYLFPGTSFDDACINITEKSVTKYAAALKALPSEVGASNITIDQDSIVCLDSAVNLKVIFQADKCNVKSRGCASVTQFND